MDVIITPCSQFGLCSSLAQVVHDECNYFGVLPPDDKVINLSLVNFVEGITVDGPE